jgi:hypothetical protein
VNQIDEQLLICLLKRRRPWRLAQSLVNLRFELSTVAGYLGSKYVEQYSVYIVARKAGDTLIHPYALSNCLSVGFFDILCLFLPLLISSD